MRYSGLRIGDAVTFATSALWTAKPSLYPQRTQVPVYCPLPKIVIDAVDDVVPVTERHYFWTGASDIRSITGKLATTVSKAVHTRRREGRHPHRFRDTFSVELLAGVPIKDVSILLEHSPVKITERAYAPLVQARQQRLELAVKKAW
jgi:integrase